MPNRDNPRAVLGVVCLLALFGCGGQSHAGDGDTGGTGGTGGAPEGGAPADLTGTWDAIGSMLGETPIELTITLDAQHIEVTTSSGSFVAERDASGFHASYTVDTISKPIVGAQQNAGSMRFGIIPLDLSGSWSVRNFDPSDGYGCDATLSTTGASGLCSATKFPPWADGYNPGAGSATGAKMSDAPSSFGDLGGVWKVTFSKGSTCTFRFEAATFSSDCGSSLGGLTITFSGSMASGNNTRGFELSAKRR